jgi:signal transduction histidine kinase
MPSQRVQFHIDISPDAAKFIFDPSVLSIALGNLVQNAVQASPVGATVTISARRIDGQVGISIEDQGEGISPQNLENIFNPFFTTKTNGIGLGLAIVSKIVDEHRGKIVPASTPGQGTSFQITLPAETSPLADMSAPPVTA